MVREYHPVQNVLSGNNIFIIVLIFFMLASPALAEETGLNNESKEHAQSLILMYVVGSDLESGNGHPSGGTATTDLLHMVEGYGNTSPADLNIVVGYGGAAVPGWGGMTIVPISNLIDDAQDGIIGNEGLGVFDPDIDMGSRAGLSSFLTRANEQYSGDKTYLLLWDHGDGFGGFGADENSGNMLSITNITSSLEESGSRYDLIGFDACLMSGIEVAKALQPYARYLVSSEEISAGGWTYKEWISTLAQNPTQEPEETGKVIIDTFFHQDQPLGNTASLIDLSRIDPVIEKLDEFGVALNETLLPEDSILPIARAYEKTTRFGENAIEGQNALKIDLGTLVDHLVSTVPQAQAAGDDLKATLKDAVVYERHDELMSNATGLSVADPLTLPSHVYEELSDVLSLSPGWDRFVESVREHLNEEIPAPDIASVGTNTYQILEPTGSEQISVLYFAITNETGELLQLGSMPLTLEEDGNYTMPDWDGEWYYLQDTLDPDQVALIDLYYGDTTGSGISKFISSVDIIRNGTQNHAVMYSYIDPDSTWTRYSIRPYEVDDNQTIFSRNGFTPEAGDTLLTYADAYDLNGNETGQMLLGAMKLSGGMNITSGLLPDGAYGWTLQVTSPYGEQKVSDVRLLTIQGGVVEYISNVTEEQSGNITTPVSVPAI